MNVGNAGAKVFEQLVDSLTARERYAEDASDDYWLASDCMPIEDEDWCADNDSY